MTACFDYSTETGHKLSTLVNLLGKRAQNQSGCTAYTFLQDGETASIRLTYKELAHLARAIAAELQSGASSSWENSFTPPTCLNEALGDCSFFQATAALATTSVLANVEDRLDHYPELAAMRWLNTDNLASDLAQLSDQKVNSLLSELLAVEEISK